MPATDEPTGDRTGAPVATGPTSTEEVPMEMTGSAAAPGPTGPPSTTSASPGAASAAGAARPDLSTTGADDGSIVVTGDAETDISRKPSRTGAAASPAGPPSAAGAGAAGADLGPSAPQPAPAASVGAGEDEHGMGEAAAGGPAGAPVEGRAQGAAPLFGDAGELSLRWQSVQVTFVDEPRRAVQDADQLVSEMMDRLAELFRSQHEDLEQAWNAGGDVSTEDLRVALQRYRSFFERLLAA